MDWQTFSAIVAVIAAAIWLLRMYGLQVSSEQSTGCGSGSCGTCPANPHGVGKPFVGLGELQQSSGRKR